MTTDCRNPVESANKGKGVLSNCASGCETLGTVESGIVTLNDSVMIWLAALAGMGPLQSPWSQVRQCSSRAWWVSPNQVWLVAFTTLAPAYRLFNNRSLQFREW